MSAIQSLENAIIERIRKQELFKIEVKAALSRAFNRLPVCNSNDEVSSTININKDKFASLLEKLHNDKSLNREAVQQLIQSTNIKNLKKGPNSRLSESFHTANGSESYHTANGLDKSYHYIPFGEPPDTDVAEEFHFGGKRSKTRRR